MEVKRAVTQQDFFNCVHIRTEVFVMEQQVDVNIEQDQRDLTAIHLIAYMDALPVGCLRILTDNNEISVGRVAVKKEFRRNHVGALLMQAVETLPEVQQVGKVTLHAQRTAVDFYLYCGYTIASEPYMEAGIEHVMMEKKL